MPEKNPQPKKLNLKQQLSPEEIQAKFWSDFGNGVLNQANFMGAIASQIDTNLPELTAEIGALRVEMEDFNHNFRAFLMKVHNIPPDELNGLESEEPEEPGENNE